jgi:uncharacterized protein YbbK (DUF523 family)
MFLGEEGFDGDLSRKCVIPNEYRYDKRTHKELYFISHQASPKQRLVCPEPDSGLATTLRAYFFVSNKWWRPI